MTYFVNEIFYTLQGEGYWTGRPAVFCRFSRCNLWTGREEDRHKAVCQFCDTDFLHGDKLTLDELMSRILEQDAAECRFIVLTGGEPTLQIDTDLLGALHSHGFYVAIETNGTRRVPLAIDWVCVSPKAGTTLVQKRGDELKVVWPQTLNLQTLVRHDFAYFWLSPMDGPQLAENTTAAIEYCLANPRWSLSIQTHKLIGMR